MSYRRTDNIGDTISKAVLTPKHRQEERDEIAGKMAEYEAKSGKVKTLPIIVRDKK